MTKQRLTTRILTLMLLLLSVTVRAANYITIEDKDGGWTSFQLSLDPRLSFTSEALVLTCGESRVEYPLDAYARFFYTDDDVTSVRELGSSFSFDGNSGEGRIAPGARVLIYNVSGTLLSETVADADGRFRLSFPGSGLYIVRAGSKTFKYLNK